MKYKINGQEYNVIIKKKIIKILILELQKI